MSRLLGLDKAANTISSSLPEASRIIANKLPEAATALTKNAPETFTAAAKALTENLPEALSQAAKVLAESSVKDILIANQPSQFDKNIKIIQTVAMGVAAAGIFVASFSYAYSVYKQYSTVD